MIVVGLDCSGDDLAVGLVIGDHLAGSWRTTARHRHSALLPGEILSRLQEKNLTLAEVDGFAIISGPGSYTGLRVGAATIMGLAEEHSVPVAALSSFEFLYRVYKTKDRRLGCIIPCRGEFYYWRLYMPGEDTGSQVLVLTAAEIVRSLDKPIRLVGPRVDEFEKYLSASRVDVELIGGAPPDGGGLLALWGKEKIVAGQIIDWDNYQLNYGPAPGFRQWSRPTR